MVDVCILIVCMIVILVEFQKLQSNSIGQTWASRLFTIANRQFHREHFNPAALQHKKSINAQGAVIPEQLVKLGDVRKNAEGRVVCVYVYVYMCMCVCVRMFVCVHMSVCLIFFFSFLKFVYFLEWHQIKTSDSKFFRV